MKRLLLLLTVIIAISATAQSLDKRVVHNEPANYRLLTAVHAGAGQMKFTQLIGSNILSTNFLYLHAGEIFFDTDEIFRCRRLGKVDKKE